ncbi:MAG: hypothetical protein H6623_00310 [Bdellovibrionaceae bacterium]|nr:hypothetical protein [Pseudobdellovibrionaceae bacterium]
MRIAFLLFVLLLAANGNAAIFSEEETQIAMNAGRQSIINSTRAHYQHLQKTGIGLFYGVRSDYSPIKHSTEDDTWSDLERFSYIKTVLKKDFVTQLGSADAVDSYARSLVGMQESTPRSGDIQITGSLLWTLRHLRAAYASVGKEKRARQIVREVLKNDNGPNVLMKELQKDGWEAIYWNPDVAQPNETNGKLRQMHQRSVQEAQNGLYNNRSIFLQHTLVNYRPSSNSKTKKSLSSLKRLEHIPFWVGLANYGRQTFVGYLGRVSESHSSEMPISRMLIKESLFADWQGYTREKYLSGIIMIPPGAW